jgi:RimJ/RimL family protein N-acetyltransferase
VPQQPILHTLRLLLRPFQMSDAPAVKRYAGERDIANGTGRLPHPYTNGMADAWIMTHEELFATNKEAIWAIVAKDDNTFIGSIGLVLSHEDHNAELGFWIGLPHWGCGYATEAARELVRYAFEQHEHPRLEKVFARHFARNPSSGRVLQKIGMTQEGIQRKHFMKWEQLEDLVLYGLLREEWQSAPRSISRNIEEIFRTS